MIITIESNFKDWKRLLDAYYAYFTPHQGVDKIYEKCTEKLLDDHGVMTQAYSLIHEYETREFHIVDKEKYLLFKMSR